MNAQASSARHVGTTTHWHAHAYFDESTLAQAIAFCELAAAQLPVQMGRVHQKQVGPHPRWSCQLSFVPKDFATVVVWLNDHRDGLTIFVHPNTGDDLADHRDRAIWLGDSAVLNLELFE